MYLSQLSRIYRIGSTHSQTLRYLRRTQMTQSVTTPLWKATEDGLETLIDEADLYKYQRYRNDESHNLAIRYRKFNLPALLSISAGLYGSDRTKCVKLLKCVEGQFNKAFILTMSDGNELVARLPNPNAGPVFYTIASEVATRHFLRDVIGIPLPRVYAWSAEPSNPVGAEYIIEEKAIGESLGKLWDGLSIARRLEIVDQVVDMEKKLATISFPKHGCIYYESDLKPRSLSYERLDLPIGSSSVSSLCPKGALPDFAIGPSTNLRFWEGERATMMLDRGPWNSVAEYAIAIGKNEQKWAESYAQPRMNIYRSLEHHEVPHEYVSLLERYTTLAPYLVSSLMSIEQANTMSHPDLHLDNIFVDPITNEITCIIDWQHASASPTIVQRLYPQMLELSTAEQSDKYKDEKILLDHYLDAVKEADPLRRKTLREPLLNIKIDPISLVPGCWDRGDLFSLRNALITVIARWDDILCHKTSCPIDFTNEELLQHQSEMELVEGVSGIIHQLQDEGLVPLGGMVRRQDYEHAKGVSDILKQKFVDLADNDKQRELHGKIWPYA